MKARDRSLPHKGPFAGALLLTFVHYLSLVGFAAGLLLLLERRDTTASWFVGAAAAAAGATWLLAYLKRRDARCPLCRGTPFLDSGAHVHQRATRLFPLNHGTTAMLSCIFTQRFRCMYCGNRYDLLRRRSRPLDDAVGE